jgi:hypothetical protein
MMTSQVKPDANDNDLRTGERGAIMVIGVFLACSMIAAMWYVMGIGDAILWRDRSQEAADSIAYTSAAIHARGMNFIAMCNIIMLIIVGLYLLMCMIRSVLDLILYVTGDPVNTDCIPISGLSQTEGHGFVNIASTIIKFFTSKDSVPRYPGGILDSVGGILAKFGDNAAGRDLLLNIDCGSAVTVCCESNHPLETIANPVGKAYVMLEKAINIAQKIMDVALPVLHGLEVETAFLNPWIGAGAGAYAGAQYKEQLDSNPNNFARHYGVAISPSMFRNLKKPTEQEKLRDIKDDEYINYTGNGCGPTMCGDGKVSRSGGKTISSGYTDCCSCGSADCKCQGPPVGNVCSGHNGPGDQSKLYEKVQVDNGKDYRIGLPVQADNMNTLCKKAMVFLGEGINDLLGSIPGLGQIMKTSFMGVSIGGLIQKLFDGLGDWFTKAYCLYEPSFGANHTLNGKYLDNVPDDWKDKQDPAATFWAIKETDSCPFSKYHPLFSAVNSDHGGGNGPMIMAPYAPNGGDYMQVYGIIFNTRYNMTTGEYGTKNTETAWSKISLAVGPANWNKQDYTEEGQDALGLKGNGPLFYISEAEFYHDCEANWDDLECNGADHAVYRLNWRTRLRRVYKPVYVTELLGKMKVGGAVSKIGGFITKNSWVIENIASELGMGDTTNIFSAIETLTNFVGDGQLMPTVIH